MTQTIHSGAQGFSHFDTPTKYQGITIDTHK